MHDWIDVGQPLTKEMVFWPGQVPVSFQKISDMDSGHMANVTKVSMSVHTGTHMDAPCHFLNNGADISAMPLEVGLGKVRVVEYREKGHILAKDIEAYENRAGKILEGERIFFKTLNSDVDWVSQEFKTDYIGLSADGAAYLRDRKISLVGIDYLSIAPFNDLPTPHHLLLGNNTWIVEGLKLTQISEGEYELICLPLKISGADGSPARVLVRTIK